MSSFPRIRVGSACAGVLLLGTVPARGADLPLREWAGHDEVVLALDFEGGPYAWKAAGTPTAAGATPTRRAPLPSMA